MKVSVPPHLDMSRSSLVDAPGSTDVMAIVTTVGEVVQQ